VQARQPVIEHDPEFLKHVLIRSLESGMSDDLRPTGRITDATKTSRSRELDNPSFIRDKLERDDPRAVDFRQQVPCSAYARTESYLMTVRCALGS
jgi:hypothetical protein